MDKWSSLASETIPDIPRILDTVESETIPTYVRMPLDKAMDIATRIGDKELLSELMALKQAEDD